MSEQLVRAFPDTVPEIVPIAPILQANLLDICRVESPGNHVDGNPDANYYDLDALLAPPPAGEEERFRVTTSGLIQAVAQAIAVMAEQHPIDTTAYFRRPGGPVGMSQFGNSIAQQTRRPIVQIDPRARYRVMQLRPELAMDTNATILTDMTSTGREIVEASRVLWNHGLKHVTALAVFETGNSRELLASMDIPLTSLIKV